MADSDDAFDEDFGGIDDAALLAAEAAVNDFPESPRPNKRPRLTDPQRPLRTIGSNVVSRRSIGTGGEFESEPFEISSQVEYGTYRVVAPQSNLKQTTLFGAHAETQHHESQDRVHNWPLAQTTEPPTHHKLDDDELKTWVYPTNLGSIRDYQFNIVARGLYHNLLVALPTGLGKTFIAATIMLNWFRWTRDSQIVFVAPTRPLVSQQVDACFKIAGIPRSATTMLTGGIPPGIRAEEWNEKRVFFMTPQTIVNDLKSGICDPKRIVLVVVDEAHRATGNYAYVEVVRFLRRFNTSFRILALTATPGSSVESVQEVVDGLGISRVEIRTEESLDIRQYVHQRNIEVTLFEYSEEMILCMDLFSKALQPLVSKVTGLNAYWSNSPMTLTAYGCTQASRKWMASDAGQRAHWGLKSMVLSIFSILASLAHAIELLKFHGIGPFFHKLVDFRNETEKNGAKAGKYRREVNESEHFIKLMNTVQSWVNDKDFVGHPKLEALRTIALNHFMDAGEGRGTGGDQVSPAGTRIMVFAHYRDSAEEIARVLNRNSPMVRAHVFVGQANAKGSEGMDQKKQLDTIEKFRSGVFNTLVATSIGEEGLDIGEVDLIVCYDGSASPIRMLQRMGRTGRKRAGNIEVLLMKDKEHDNFMKAKDNYEKMQEMIASGKRFTFHENLSPRIVPREVQPVVDKREVEIPVENTQAELPEPKRRAAKTKKPPKKFNMPDGVRTGFTKASRLEGGPMDGLVENNVARSPSPVATPPDEAVFLSEAELAELDRSYLSVSGEGVQIVEPPRLDAHSTLQRMQRPTGKVRHGRACERVVSMLAKVHKARHMSASSIQRNFESALQEEDQQLIEGRASHLSYEMSDEEASQPMRTGDTLSGAQPMERHLLQEELLESQVTLRTESEIEDVLDTGSDLVDFIDDGETAMHEERSSSQSSPPPTQSGKSVGPGKVALTSSLLSEEGVPEIMSLLQKPQDAEDSDVGEIPRARRRRAVIDSDSEYET